MNTILSFQSGILQALGMSIIHSLWEGALILLPILLMLNLIKKEQSGLRYIVLYSGLMVMLFVFLYTFLHVYQSISPLYSYERNGALYLSSAQQSPVNPTDLVFNGGYFRSLMQWSLSAIDPVAPILALLWFIGFIITGIRLIAGLYVSQVIIRKNTLQPEYHEQQTFNRIRRLLKVNPVVQLRLSVRKISPMVVGVLKPVVIVPLAAIANLSPSQTEAIIAHELAHIRRYDHVLLIIQGIAEQVLFFHPLTWYLSSAINREREHCCDDLALKTCADPINYIKALTMVQELNLAGITPANGIISKPKRLLSRIKRMIHPEENHSPLLRLATMFAFLVVAGLVLGTTIGIPFNAKNSINRIGAYTTQQVPENTGTDTLKTIIVVLDGSGDSLNDTSVIKVEEEVIISITDQERVKDSREIRITMANDTIREITVNGRSIPPEQFEMYQDSVKTKQRVEIMVTGSEPDSVSREQKRTTKEIEIIIKDTDPDVSTFYRDYIDKILADIYVDPESYRNILQKHLKISQEEMQHLQEYMKQYQLELKEQFHLGSEERARIFENIQKSLALSQEERQQTLEKMKEAEEMIRQAQEEIRERMKMSREERQQALEERQRVLEEMQEHLKMSEEEQQRAIEEMQKHRE
ncbi:MAG: M48 family metalloprotease [Bacteroidales bacterium]|nr:M48 family metalloprotease [Bacteroidales bacterium]